ncbi:UNVERIFIED_CONTAM: hypothetical protein RMT77_014728 [Armadillidium vulgare]
MGESKVPDGDSSRKKPMKPHQFRRNQNMDLEGKMDLKKCKKFQSTVEKKTVDVTNEIETKPDYAPSGSVDKLDPNHSSDFPGQPKDSGVDYVPEEVAPQDGKHSSYGPDEVIPHHETDLDKDIPYEGTGSDYVPDKDVPFEGSGYDNVPDKDIPNEGTGSDYVPDKDIPYEGTGSDYVPDKDIPYGGTGSDYVPDKDVPYEGTGSDYVPDKDIPYEGTGSDYVPDKDIPYGGTGSDYVPDKEIPIEQPGYDHVPDKASPDYGISTGYLPPKEISPEGKGSDSFPDKDTPLEGVGSEYVPENSSPHKKPDTNYVPYQGIEELEEEISNSYGPDYEGSPKDSVQEYIPQKGESYGKGSDHNKSESEVSWYEKLKRKWNVLEESAQEGFDSVGRAIHTTVQGIKGNFNALWDKFKKVLSNFGYEIQRGARYVFTVISTSVEEVKASELIEKLEQRLEQGNEIVDEFFQKVGQKMTHWAQEHNHENVDEGLFLEIQQSKENNFLDIFQDPEIHQQVDKMVSGGVITQEEADLFSQIKQTKGEEILDSSYSGSEYVDSHSSSNIEGNIDQLDASGASYGTEGHVDHSAYDNQDAKPHQTTKKELEGHTVEDNNKGDGRHDLKTINFPVKG